MYIPEYDSTDKFDCFVHWPSQDLSYDGSWDAFDYPPLGGQPFEYAAPNNLFDASLYNDEICLPNAFDDIDATLEWDSAHTPATFFDSQDVGVQPDHSYSMQDLFMPQDMPSSFQDLPAQLISINPVAAQHEMNNAAGNGCTFELLHSNPCHGHVHSPVLTLETRPPSLSMDISILEDNLLPNRSFDFSPQIRNSNESREEANDPPSSLYTGRVVQSFQPLSKPQRFQCLEDGCGKGFTELRSLRRHGRTAHRSSKPFHCLRPSCQSPHKRYKRKDGLQKHMQKKHGENDP